MNNQSSDKIQGALAVVEFLHRLFSTCPPEKIDRDSVLEVLELARHDIKDTANLIYLDVKGLGLSSLVDEAIISYIRRTGKTLNQQARGEA